MSVCCICDCALWELLDIEYETYFNDILVAILERDVTICVLLTSDSFMRALNQKFRNIDRTTNVLSFPEDENVNIGNVKDGFFLGNIVFAYQQIEKEVTLYCKKFEERLAHLFVHGILHMLGFDHVIDYDREKMECMEIAVLQKLGISDPYVMGEDV